MSTRHSNSRRERERTALAGALWPSARIGEALYSLARRAGLPATCPDACSPPPDLPADQMTTWIEAAADRGGIQADQVFVALGEIPTVVSQGAPALLRLRAVDGEPFLAIVGSGCRFVSTLGPDLRIHRLRVATVCATVRQPFEAPIEPEVDGVLDRVKMAPRSRERARAAMIAERLNAARFRGCWLLRLPAGARVRDEAREVGLPRRVAVLVSAHLIQYVLFVLSWWLLGRGALNGTIDRGWLLGWMLLLVSLVPFRLLTTWAEGLIAVAAGASLRRRLLRGALRIDRQEVRRKGAGQLFGLVVEAAAIESLALSGGLLAFFSLIELGIAAVVLCAGAGVLAVPLLAAWAGLDGWLAWRYVRRRRTWTDERLLMTDHLLECMVGHRTRLVQQPVDERHLHEDESLDRYVETGRAMDRSSLWLTAIVPRGWLFLAFAALAPALVAGSSPARVAVSIGGMLLAYRALRRLSTGLSNLTGAAIAGYSVAPLARAASRREAAPSPSVALAPRHQDRTSVDAVAVHARDLTFRYRGQGEPVLRGCTLSIPRGARLLLEGPSGSGKTTFASMLAGLQAPESGLLLVDGLDRSVLGAAGWRSRVIMAPQAHDNYLVGGSLAFNLLMGRRWPAQREDLTEAEEVCRELGLGELLDRLPGGLHQAVGETGWQLSQGERTRVFLARALLQRPELLVLDESFSALDSENVDRAIRCVLHRAPTLLAIAHT